MHFLVDEKVAQFQISVDDFMAVHVFQCAYDLHNVALNLKLMQSLPPSQNLVEGLIVAELKENIDIVMIFEEMLKTDDMLVPQTPVNLDL